MVSNSNSLIFAGSISLLISVGAYPLMMSKHGLLVTSLLFIYALSVEFIIINYYENNLISKHHNILRVHSFKIHALDLKLTNLLSNIGILSFLLTEAAIVERYSYSYNAVNTNYGIVIVTLWVNTIVSMLILKIRFNEMLQNSNYRLRRHNH